MENKEIYEKLKDLQKYPFGIQWIFKFNQFIKWYEKEAK